MEKIGMWLIVAAAGVLNAVQTGSNAELHRTMREQTFLAASVLFGTGLVAAVSLALLTGQTKWPSASLAQMPWWGWIGGLLGGVYVYAMLAFSGQLGAAVFVCVTVTLSIVTSVLMDHFGVMGMEQVNASGWRIGGAILMIAGVTMLSLSK
ncbi:DMT family transporter [Lewinella sp. IMCC34183]|uniref:DMT family transporter n=1 Tax=Lewinella sp. IMCC34183 TaxID=2248762 RepID=UPI000E2856FD|nr:DMT family transporter [Lewinella sp. IMCC34183]